jgi:SAM-dependent methyltransferase
MEGSSRGRRLVGAIYSAIASNIYEPLIVKGTFRLFGGRLNSEILTRSRSAVDAAKGRAVLDMPVGTGYFTLDAARAASGPVVGCDIAHGMLLETKAAADRSPAPNLVLVRADAHHLPFADGSFAAVMCWNGLQVIPGLEATVSELVRVLAPGGRLMVSVLTLPVGALLPPRQEMRVPNLLASRQRFVDEFEQAGVVIDDVSRDSLATLISGVKPSGSVKR